MRFILAALVFMAMISTASDIEDEIGYDSYGYYAEPTEEELIVLCDDCLHQWEQKSCNQTMVQANWDEEGNMKEKWWTCLDNCDWKKMFKPITSGGYCEIKGRINILADSCTASSHVDGEQAWHGKLEYSCNQAIDNFDSTYWKVKGPDVVGNWIDIKFPTEYIITHMRLENNYDGLRNKQIELKFSDGITQNVNTYKHTTVAKISNTNRVKSVRVTVLDVYDPESTDTSGGITTIKFYEKESTLSVPGYSCRHKKCVIGKNMIKYKDYKAKQCADACNGNKKCVGFEYYVNHGGKKKKFSAKDCILNSSINMKKCSAGAFNLDFCRKDVKFEKGDSRNDWEDGCKSFNGLTQKECENVASQVKKKFHLINDADVVKGCFSADYRGEIKSIGFNQHKTGRPNRQWPNGDDNPPICKKIEKKAETEVGYGETSGIMKGSLLMNINTLLGAAFMILSFYGGYVFAKKTKGQNCYVKLFETDEIQLSNM